MQRRRAIKLAREIRALYAQTCELATRYNESVAAEYRPLREAYRARPQKLVPELEYFETIFDRQEAIERAMKEPQVRMWATAYVTLSCLAAVLVLWQTSNGPSLIAVSITAAVLLAMTVGYQYLIVGGPRMRRALRQQLVERGVPICLECGYDLRGQCEPRCSECGTAARHLLPAEARRSGDLAAPSASRITPLGMKAEAR